MTRVYVGNLEDGCSKRELEREMEYYGPLRDVWVARNPPGFAFVVFEDRRDAEDAVRHLNGRRICGCRVRVEVARGPTRGGRAARLGLTEKCYECGRIGHFARDCTRRPGSYRSGRSRSRSPRKRWSRSRSYSPRRRQSKSRSKSKSGSRSRSRSRFKSRSKSESKSRSRSRSESKEKKVRKAQDSRSPSESKEPKSDSDNEEKDARYKRRRRSSEKNDYDDDDDDSDKEPSKRNMEDVGNDVNEEKGADENGNEDDTGSKENDAREEDE